MFVHSSIVRPHAHPEALEVAGDRIVLPGIPQPVLDGLMGELVNDAVAAFLGGLQRALGCDDE